MESQQTSESQKKRTQRRAERDQRRTVRGQKRAERKLARQASGSREADLAFASNLVETVSEGVHELIRDVLRVVQERQASKREMQGESSADGPKA
jgi:hypothetical protein